MKFFVSLLSILSPAVVGVMGALIGPLNIPPDALSEYFKLFKLCEDAGANSYVGVLYQNDQYVTYKFGQCYPYQLSNGNLAKMAVFCKSSTCNNNPNPDCTGGAVPPAPIIVPEGLTLINAADFVQYIGQGATCQSNALS